MKKIVALVIGMVIAAGIQSQESHLIPVFDRISLYNNSRTLASLASEMQAVPDGVYRLSTSTITTQLSEEMLNLLSGSMWLNVAVGAACDNFDRIGRVNLALVPKDHVAGPDFPYIMAETTRMELARFITPFMDRSRMPNAVPYVFQVSHLQHIFQCQTLRENYNFWIELAIGGIPIPDIPGANQIILNRTGCRGRQDIFYGSVSFFTTPTPTTVLETDNVFIPLFNSVRFNNWQAEATDVLGQTVRSVTFDVSENLTDAQFVLTVSNHGANAGGEEYTRRWHFVYLNDEEIFRFLPGRATCEPFRIFNTQENGIYGGMNLGPHSDSSWQVRSNWCPGDVIDIRTIPLGALTAGEHTFRIEVPDAVFPDAEGNFPLTLFLQGKTSGTLNQNPEVRKITGTIRGSLCHFADTIIPSVTFKNDRGTFSVTNYSGEFGVFTFFAEANRCMTITPVLWTEEWMMPGLCHVGFADRTHYPFNIQVCADENHIANQDFRLIPITDHRDTISIVRDTTITGQSVLVQRSDTLTVISDTVEFSDVIIITDTLTLEDITVYLVQVQIRDTVATLLTRFILDDVVFEDTRPDTLTTLRAASFLDTTLVVRTVVHSDTTEVPPPSNILNGSDQPTAIVVWPNPTSSELHVKWNYAESADFMILNASGQLVMQGRLQNGVPINVQALPSGIYYLRVVGRYTAIITFIKI